METGERCEPRRGGGEPERGSPIEKPWRYCTALIVARELMSRLVGSSVFALSSHRSLSDGRLAAMGGGGGGVTPRFACTRHN